MGHMLDALKQIQATSPPTPRGIKPLSPDELEAFGFRQPVEHRQEEDLPEKSGEPVAEVSVSEKAPEAPEAAKPDRGVARLLSPLAEEHREQYGELADNILAVLSPVRPAVLMFTSAGDGEGKTETLASLAVVLAEKVTDEIVAVDANFRAPALASHFGIWVDRGLIDVLDRGTAYREVIRKTSVQGLSVLPGGRFPGDGGRPPEDAKLAAVLDALRLRYRFVLVDTASLLYPEVAPLSTLCEGTYLVVELGRTARRAARQAVRLIEDCGGQVLGCVLTNVPVDS